MSEATAGRVEVEIVEREAGRVHRLTVARPAKLNVLGTALSDALRAALEQAAADDDARLVVIAGAGERAWIGGADIAEMAALDPAGARAFIEGLHATCAAVRNHPLPVIAAIRGHCLGAGLEVAACCDLRLAAPDARFAMPEVRVGVPSVIEAALLPRLVGAGRARDLVLTGRVVDAGTALAWGLVDAVDADLDALVETRAGEILAGAPGAIAAQKRLCRDWERLDLDASIRAGVEAFEAAYRAGEPGEWMRRFLERDRG